MISARKFFPIALAAVLFAATSAHAQFPFGRQQPPPPQEQEPDNELAIRVDRLEQQLRQLTGQIEQLQMQNQQLLQQLQRGDNPPVNPQRPAMRPQQQNVAPPPLQQQTVPPLGPPQDPNPNRRSDAFDPNADPNAPGRPRNLGQIPPQQNNQLPQGPMVLTPNSPQNQNPPPDQNPGPPQLQAVAPPTNSPKDAYDLAYGYVLRRDYALAEQSFRAFLDQHPTDRNAALANYWLGESLYQQRKYNESANVFLDIYKKYPQSQRAPDSLLRLGQSLAQLGNKEGACGSLGAVLSKYPKASDNVKKNAADEQKRIGC
jgi:tol-pal system protein YbgF